MYQERNKYGETNKQRFSIEKNRRSRFYFYLPAAFFSILLALSLPQCSSDDDNGSAPPSRPTDKIPPAMYLWITTDEYDGNDFGGVDGATVKCEEDTTALGNLPSGFTYYHRAVIVDSNSTDSDFPQNWSIPGKDRDILRNLRGSSPDIMTRIATNYDAVFDTFLGDTNLEEGITGSSDDRYWTGLKWASPGETPTGFIASTEHCDNWTSNTSDNQGSSGLGGRVEQYSLQKDISGEAPCNGEHHILCLSY